MAQGSHKTWGGWEAKACAECQERIVLSRGHASHHHNQGRPFSLCGPHMHLYSKFVRQAAA